MTNEELDAARALEAQRLFDANHYNGIRDKMFWDSDAIIAAARLAREGWMPPVAVDPDLAEADRLWLEWAESAENDSPQILASVCLKRGRALVAAEAKPGVVWTKHDGINVCPVPNTLITVRFQKGHYEMGHSSQFDWWRIGYYAIVGEPEDVV